MATIREFWTGFSPASRWARRFCQPGACAASAGGLRMPPMCAGAHRAITQGKASLLASGIVRVETHFAPMDVVSIVDAEGREFARGIANCASEEAEKFSIQKAPRSSRPAPGAPVLVTRDNIVLLQTP